MQTAKLKKHHLEDLCMHNQLRITVGIAWYVVRGYRVDTACFVLSFCVIVKSLAYILQHKWYTTISEDSI